MSRLVIALRCLKRRLSDVVYRQPTADAAKVLPWARPRPVVTAHPGRHQSSPGRPDASVCYPRTCVPLEPARDGLG
jgi:hypothetical protein